ncbi:MAG TPA: response regulator [Tepidisphaeraceae bacterium]|jgi:CheY-like chemotaxis protein
MHAKSVILVVDDTNLCRECLGPLLELRGYEVISAGGGKEALSKLIRRRPDLIVLDLAMPDIDGLMLLRMIKQKDRWKNIPIILLSGYVNQQVVVAASKAGVQEILLKASFTLKEFIARVEKHLAQKPDAVIPAVVAVVG